MTNEARALAFKLQAKVQALSTEQIAECLRMGIAKYGPGLTNESWDVVADAMYSELAGRGEEALCDELMDLEFPAYAKA